jgi:hypothetical protein
MMLDSADFEHNLKMRCQQGTKRQWQCPDRSVEAQQQPGSSHCAAVSVKKRLQLSSDHLQSSQPSPSSTDTIVFAYQSPDQSAPTTAQPITPHTTPQQQQQKTAHTCAGGDRAVLLQPT